MFFEVDYGRPQCVKTSLFLHTFTIDVSDPCEEAFRAWLNIIHEFKHLLFASLLHYLYYKLTLRKSYKASKQASKTLTYLKSCDFS